MSSSANNLRGRTKAFALDVLRSYVRLPKTTEAQILGKQVLRSGTSVGAHYREAHRARSTAEFISKTEVALQELDETIYWYELLTEGDIVPQESVLPILNEAEQLMSILVASVKTAKARG